MLGNGNWLKILGLPCWVILKQSVSSILVVNGSSPDGQCLREQSGPKYSETWTIPDPYPTVQLESHMHPWITSESHAILFIPSAVP